MLVKALSCKEEAIYENDSEMLLWKSSLDQSSFKMNGGKVEHCSVVRLTKIWKNKDVLTALNLKAYISDAMGMCQCLWNGQLPKAPSMLQHMVPSRWYHFQGRTCIFQQDNDKLHTVSITRAWPCGRSIQVPSWPTCSQAFYQLKRFGTLWNKE